jgi:hypothetical protein
MFMDMLESHGNDEKSLKDKLEASRTGFWERYLTSNNYTERGV